MRQVNLDEFENASSPETTAEGMELMPPPLAEHEEDYTHRIEISEALTLN